MIRDGQVIVSNSTLGTIAVCSLQTVLRYVHNLASDEINAPMRAGQSAHLAHETYFKGGTRKEAIRAFRKDYKQWAEENIDPTDRFRRRFTYDNLSKILRYYYQAHPLQNFIFTVDPENVEVDFEYPLSKDGHILSRGRLDAGPVREKDSNKLFILDHKHTGQINARSLGELRNGAQATNYVWAVQQHTSETIVGAMFNVIEFSQLPGIDNPGAKCRNPDHGGVAYEECQHLHVKSELVETFRGPEQIKVWKRTALKLARKYQRLAKDYPDLSDLPKVPVEGEFVYQACNGCEFNPFCHTGRQVKMIDSMFVPRKQEEETPRQKKRRLKKA